MQKETELVGRYFLTGVSKSISARLVKSNHQFFVELEDREEARLVHVDEISPRLANVPRKIRFKDGSTFECTDNDDLDHFLEQSDSFFSRLSKVEGSLKLVLIATVACFIAIYGIYRYGIPAAASFVASVTPSGVVALIDDNARRTVDQLLFSKSELEEQRKTELTAIFDALVQINGQTDPPLKLHFRDGGRLGANAVALPGGTIILTDQLEAIAENDDELAGVFAHEIGHVARQHSLKQIYRAAGIAFMISVIGGESEQIVEEVLGAAVLVDGFRHSREFEEEADAYSVELITQTEYNPIAFIDLLDRLIESYGIDKDFETSWTSTHPANKDRRALVEREIERLIRP